MAKLAGVPESVLKRANELVNELSDNDITTKAKAISVGINSEQEPKQTTKKAKAKEDENQTHLFNRSFGNDENN